MPETASRQVAVGSRRRRVEDDRLLMGAGKYVDDLDNPGFEVAFVRSPYASARILDIDVARVLDVDDVFAVYTYEDLPAPTNVALPVSVPHQGLTAPRTPYALARDTVRYVGEPIAMVVAKDRYIAEDACSAIAVQYDVRDACIGIESSSRGDVVVHDDMNDNIAGVIMQETGDVEGAIAAAEHVIEFDLAIERSLAAPIEGRGVFARVDTSTGKLLVSSSTQVPHALRAALAYMLGINIFDVDVVTPDVGGAFGMKGVRPWPEEVMVAWAARRFPAGLRWIEDRRENFTSSAHERRQKYHVTVGFDGSGRIFGYDIVGFQDIGAYSQYGLVVGQNASAHMIGPYAVGSKRVSLTALYTNAVMIAPYRGAGRPEGTFVMERILDRVSSYLNADRVEVRGRNLVKAVEMPARQGFRGQDGQEIIYDSGDYRCVLDCIRDRIEWDRRGHLKRDARRRGRRLGVGIACYVENTGSGPYEGASITVTPEGNVRVTVGSPSQGQGHDTMLAQIVSDQIGVAMEDVDVISGDTRLVERSIGTFASRSAVTLGSATRLACEAVRRKAIAIASRVLEADPEEIELAGGFAHVIGAPDANISLAVLAALADSGRYPFLPATKAAAGYVSRVLGRDVAVEPGLSASAKFAPAGSTYACGAHGVVLETDAETAEVVVRRYCVVHDCGSVINPMIVDGQIHGGVAQGIAGALYERMEYDDHGQLLNASFMDFLMPYVTEIPRVEIIHLETRSPGNPLGAKGAGEAGVIPVAAAVASALEDAEGVDINRLPISPSELNALRRARLVGDS